MFGIFGHPDAAAITALGLHALQHRGQEAAGIVSFDGKRFHSERRLGLVGDNFSRREVIDRLPGNVGRRPCALFDHRRNHPAQRAAAVRRTRRRRLRDRPQRQSDQRPDAAPPAGARRRHDAVDHRHRGDPASGRALQAQPLHRPLHRGAARSSKAPMRFVGADQQEADRRPRSARHPSAGDRQARRPSDPRVGDLRARHHRREIRPRRRERRGRRVRRQTACIRTSRSRRWRRGPASSNTSISRGRIRSSAAATSTTCARPCGAELAREAPANADVVVPVPDSGVPAAIGYAQESGIPFELGIIRNHYVGRTFIEPTPAASAQLGVRLKHSANRAVVNGKRIVLIDDSIVRGTTSIKIVQMMRDAGATRGAFPHRLAADHPSRLLRHRHAGARQAAGGDPRSRRHARLHRRRFAGVPVGRRHLPRHGLRAARSGCGRNSPTIASPATIRPRSPTRPDTKRGRGNCRCWPKRANAQLHSERLQTSRALAGLPASSSSPSIVAGLPLPRACGYAISGLRPWRTLE